MSLNWGIIGTGNIATKFAEALKVSQKGKLVAVASRKRDTAVAFGARFNVAGERCYEMTALFDDNQVDIVYIATPHPQHCEIAVAAANAKKHILVEKPAAMNRAELDRILQAVQHNEVFFMEAYMYRCHPQTFQLIDLVREGRIGQVKLIQAGFAFDGLDLGPESRLWRNDLGGGAILDIGGYPMSFVRLVARTAGYGESNCIKGVGHLSNQKVDEWATASLRFQQKESKNEIGAQIFTSVIMDSDSSVEIIGTEGSLRVPNLWRPDLGPVHIEVKAKDGSLKETLPVKLSETNIFTIEADAVADAVSQGSRQCQYMTWEDSLGQMDAMDQWRKEIGLEYEADRI